MNADDERQDDPLARIRDIPRIQAAIHKGIRAALRRHKQAGNPVAVWRDGQVVWIAPEDIPVDADVEPDA